VTEMEGKITDALPRRTETRDQARSIHQVIDALGEFDVEIGDAAGIESGEFRLILVWRMVISG